MTEAPGGTTVGISIASLPGKTVWQKEMTSGSLLTADTVPVPSTQKGRLSKGLTGLPSAPHHAPPYCLN